MWILPVVVLALASAGASDDRPSSPLLAPGSSWQKVVGGLGFGEGPAWHPDGYLLFEDVANNRTLKLDRADQVSVFRETTDGANGLAFDAARRPVACEGDAAGRGRRLVRIEKDGTLTVLAERYGGKRLNSPNDLAIDVADASTSPTRATASARTSSWIGKPSIGWIPTAPWPGSSTPSPG